MHHPCSEILKRFSPSEISLYESLYGPMPILTSAQRALIVADLRACEMVRQFGTEGERVGNGRERTAANNRA